MKKAFNTLVHILTSFEGIKYIIDKVKIFKFIQMNVKTAINIGKRIWKANPVFHIILTTAVGILFAIRYYWSSRSLAREERRLKQLKATPEVKTEMLDKWLKKNISKKRVFLKGKA